MSLKVFKALAAGTSSSARPSSTNASAPKSSWLTVSALFINELGFPPPTGVRINGFTQSRGKIDRTSRSPSKGPRQSSPRCAPLRKITLFDRLSKRVCG
jgi:hypothetical protein